MREHQKGRVRELGRKGVREKRKTKRYGCTKERAREERREGISRERGRE